MRADKPGDTTGLTIFMKIVKSIVADVPLIFTFYDWAVEYQKAKFNKHWLPFDEYLVKKEVAEGRQWKVMEGDQVVCIFAITYEDPYIWGEKNEDAAMYIHRIVTHPSFHGRAYVKAIIEWAREHAVVLFKRFIRMDTWGDNDKLISYYSSCGFNYIGTVTPEATNELPKHYSAIFLSLFEIDLGA